MNAYSSQTLGPHARSERTQIRVVVVEDIKEVRDGLVTLLKGTAGYDCVADYRSMEAALARVEDDAADVVLTDIGLPGMSGIEGIRILRSKFPQLLLIALTVYDNNDKIFDALCAGASGYLLKNTTPVRILEAIQEVTAGGAPMSPDVARKVVKLFRDFRPPDRATYHLTGQETELLKLLVEGHHKKTAAHELGISFHTVSFHLRNIYEKLQVHSKTEAVAKAIRERIV